MKPENSGTPAMRNRLGSGYVQEPAEVLKTSIAVPMMWKARMTFASSSVSSPKASMPICIAMAPSTRKS